jgi:hypothetical protein
MQPLQAKMPANTRLMLATKLVYCPTRNSVLFKKCWCTAPQAGVYSPTRNGVLPSKFWCTAQQEIVYCLASFGVLPNKVANEFVLQSRSFQSLKIALSVIVVYIVVYI